MANSAILSFLLTELCSSRRLTARHYTWVTVTSCCRSLAGHKISFSCRLDISLLFPLNIKNRNHAHVVCRGLCTFFLTPHLCNEVCKVNLDLKPSRLRCDKLPSSQRLIYLSRLDTFTVTAWLCVAGGGGGGGIFLCEQWHLTKLLYIRICLRTMRAALLIPATE